MLFFGIKAQQRPILTDMILLAEREKRNIRLIFVAAFVGAVSGLFGGGGGTLAVPLFEKWGLTVKESHATTIAVIMPLCLVSSVAYCLAGIKNFDAFWKIEIGVLVGGVVGALVLRKISSKLLSFVFYALMIFAGVRTLVK